MRKISAHGVDLAFDGVARNGPFGPAFWNHGTEPDILDGKQRPIGQALRRIAELTLHGLHIKRIAMQGEMCGSCDDNASKNSLELRSGLKPLHKRQASAQETADSQQIPDLRQPGVYGPWRGVQKLLRGRHAFSCVSGSRAYGRV